MGSRQCQECTVFRNLGWWERYAKSLLCPSPWSRESLLEQRCVSLHLDPPPDRAGAPSACLPAEVNLIYYEATWLTISTAGRKVWFKTIVRKIQFNLFFFSPLQNVHLLHDIILIYILYNSKIDVVSYWEGTLNIFFFLVLFYLKFFLKKIPLSKAGFSL